MISYAQNHEDVILDRCFKNSSSGFYIDVGAWHPVRDSVTKHFYDAGWSGINIEPNPEYHTLLTKDRLRDRNLALALSDVDGEVRTFTILQGSGISTLRDLPTSYLDNIESRGFQRVPIELRVTTLAKVCREYVPPGVEIDFLKIDVEGWEGKVLRGNDWHRFRPKVLVVEAATPVAYDETAGKDLVTDMSSSWQPFVLDQGYIFAFHDGLNHYYVRQESDELLQAFKEPVNCQDEYLPYRTYLVQQELATARQQIEGLAAEISQLSDQIRAQENALERSKAAIDEIRSSTSWRITLPLRVIGTQLHRPHTPTADEP
jgi:FkbM family methyltransferase